MMSSGAREEFVDRRVLSVTPMLRRTSALVDDRSRDAGVASLATRASSESHRGRLSGALDEHARIEPPARRDRHVQATVSPYRLVTSA